jgi:hypothetical protein
VDKSFALSFSIPLWQSGRAAAEGLYALAGEMAEIGFELALFCHAPNWGFFA